MAVLQVLHLPVCDDGGCCVDDVVQVVLCRWCYLDGDVLMRLC